MEKEFDFSILLGHDAEGVSGDDTENSVRTVLGKLKEHTLSGLVSWYLYDGLYWRADTDCGATVTVGHRFGYFIHVCKDPVSRPGVGYILDYRCVYGDSLYMDFNALWLAMGRRREEVGRMRAELMEELSGKESFVAECVVNPE